MKNIRYSISQRFVAAGLLMGLFLQGCNNFSNPIQPISVDKKIKIIHQIDLPQQGPEKWVEDSSQIGNANSFLLVSSTLAEEEGQVGQKSHFETNRSFVQLKSTNSLQDKYSKNSSLSQKKTRSGFLERKTNLLKEQRDLGKVQRSVSYPIKKDHSSNHLVMSTNNGVDESGTSKSGDLGHSEGDKEVTYQTFLSKEGYQVQFKQLASGEWEAVVVESLLTGINRTLLLPAYQAFGYNIASLSEHSPAWQKRHIHIIFQKYNSYVLVGAMGLLGGMMKNKKDKEDNSKASISSSSENEVENKGKDPQSSTLEQTILFCGNPGVGKSFLCNSIFQKAIFQSGANSGEGLTKEKQEHIYENRKYIDTPGLSDTKLREQAAKEIEKSLKENNNYKILFVATLESARIRPDDLVTINSVCDAIQTNFEYGIIFNKLTKGAIREIGENGENLRGYLDMLHKQPSSAIVIKKDTDMEDERNQYLPVDSEDRKKLIKFIDNLEANRILDNNVNNIDVRAYEEKIKAMELELKEALRVAKEEREVQAKLQEKLQAELEQLQRDKIAAAEQAERDKKELEIKLEAERKANEERDRKAKAELQEELKKRDEKNRQALQQLQARHAEQSRQAQEHFQQQLQQQADQNLKALQQLQAQHAEQSRQAQERFQQQLQQQAEYSRQAQERFQQQLQQQAEYSRQAQERSHQQLQQQADQNLKALQQLQAQHAEQSRQVQERFQQLQKILEQQNNEILQLRSELEKKTPPIGSWQPNPFSGLFQLNPKTYHGNTLNHQFTVFGNGTPYTICNNHKYLYFNNYECLGH